MFGFIRKFFQRTPPAQPNSGAPSAPVPTIGDVMAAYAEDAVFHASKLGFALDYSEASLEQLDAVLAKLTENGLLPTTSTEEKTAAWQRSKIYGGYLGEVVIRTMGGAWEMRDLPSGAAQAVLRSQGVQMFPPEKIFKRLTEDEYSGVSGYCRALRLIVERRPRT